MLDFLLRQPKIQCLSPARPRDIGVFDVRGQMRVSAPKCAIAAGDVELPVSSVRAQPEVLALAPVC
jgi:hypothetical protein